MLIEESAVSFSSPITEVSVDARRRSGRYIFAVPSSTCKAGQGAAVSAQGISKRKTECTDSGSEEAAESSVSCEFKKKRKIWDDTQARTVYSGFSHCSHNEEIGKRMGLGGSSLCSYGKRKWLYKECRGQSLCSHGRKKRRCKECEGSSLCSHGKVKSRCKECGRGSLCSHGRRKSLCKECGGSSFCSHGR